MKKFFIEILFILLMVILLDFFIPNKVNAGWVRGYYRSDGTWVNGYYRTEPNYWKWDNLSWDGDWSDMINDRSWYRDFGYDPEPWDDEIPNYNYWGGLNSLWNWNNYNSLLDWNNRNYNWNYDWYDWDWNYDDWYDWDWNYDWGW